MAPPNVLWICTDQQRFDTLGCCGNGLVRTPNIDRLAASGVLFERAYSTSPICTPSRACFLTGRYPRTTRARQNGQEIPADEVLVTKILSEAGYTCGLSGKLHLSPCCPDVCKGIERRIDDGYAEFHWSHHSTPSWPNSEYLHWLTERGAEYHTPPRDDCEHVLVGMPAELHQTTWCAEKAVAFMKDCARFGRPWLFSVNPFDPHHPFDPPPGCLQRHLDRLDDVPLPRYVEGELADKPRWQQMDHQGSYGGQGGFRFADMSQRDHRLVRAAYWAMCELIDAQVGRMIETLEQTGQLENTIVLFMSDHGEMLGDHGIYLKGPYFYEEAIRVPLVISWPGHIPPGRRSRALVELTDLPQTLLDAAGVAHHGGMQGRSLWPLLIGEADLHHHRDDLYCEYYNGMNPHRDPAPFLTMVATGRYKLVADHGHGGELYDLAEDPGEVRNLWGRPEHLALKAELLERLAARMAWTADPLPPRLTKY